MSQVGNRSMKSDFTFGCQESKLSRLPVCCVEILIK